MNRSGSHCCFRTSDSSGWQLNSAIKKCSSNLDGAGLSQKPSTITCYKSLAASSSFIGPMTIYCSADGKRDDSSPASTGSAERVAAASSSADREGHSVDRSTAARSRAGRSTAVNSSADLQIENICRCQPPKPISSSPKQDEAHSFQNEERRAPASVVVQSTVAAFIEVVTSINLRKHLTTMRNLTKKYLAIVSPVITLIWQRLTIPFTNACAPPRSSPRVTCLTLPSSCVVCLRQSFPYPASSHSSSKSCANPTATSAGRNSKSSTSCSPGFKVRSGAGMEVALLPLSANNLDSVVSDPVVDFKKRAAEALEAYRKFGVEILEDYKLQMDVNFIACLDQLNSVCSILEGDKHTSR